MVYLDELRPGLGKELYQNEISCWPIHLSFGGVIVRVLVLVQRRFAGEPVFGD
jgi:hypothetical protein